MVRWFYRPTSTVANAAFTGVLQQNDSQGLGSPEGFLAREATSEARI
jgi:hypothetical protein